MADRLSKANIESILEVAKKRGVVRGEFRRGNDSFSFDFSTAAPAAKTDDWDNAVGQHPPG
ncbi:MAG: hypothetical protein WBA35_00175 [Litorimonas sp.]